MDRMSQKKGLKHGIALAKALNAKVTVITVTEAPMLYLPTKADLVSWEEAREEHASKVLYKAKDIAEQSGISAELLLVPNAPQPLRFIETAKSGRSP